MPTSIKKLFLNFIFGQVSSNTLMSRQELNSLVKEIEKDLLSPNRKDGREYYYKSSTMNNVKYHIISWYDWKYSIDIVICGISEYRIWHPRAKKLFYQAKKMVQDAIDANVLAYDKIRTEKLRSYQAVLRGAGDREQGS